MDGWRKIEDGVPKDGTRILVFRSGRQYVAHWCGMPWMTWGVSATRMPGEPDDPFTDIGVKRLGDHVFADGPTHWRPLPPDPST